MTRRLAVEDIRGTVRTGPRGAWWTWLTPRRHDGIGISLEVPAGRAVAWNVAAALFATGDLYAAHWLGVLGWVLVGIAGLVAATWVAIVRIQRRIDRDGDLCRAAAWAAHRERQTRVVAAMPVAERDEVAA